MIVGIKNLDLDKQTIEDLDSMDMTNHRRHFSAYRKDIIEFNRNFRNVDEENFYFIIEKIGNNRYELGWTRGVTYFERVFSVQISNLAELREKLDLPGYKFIPPLLE
jgi:hypothetical protein